MDKEADTWCNPIKDGPTQRTDDAIKSGISQQEVKQFYQKWAATYDQDVHAATLRCADIGAEHMGALYQDKKNARILDVACGTGLVGQGLSRLGFTNLDALDASQEMLDEAVKKGVYHNMLCDFLGPNKLSIEDNSYDAVVGIGCFCQGHVREDCLAELIRVVKPGGHIVLAMREEFLLSVPVLRDNLEQCMAMHQQQGLWTQISRERVPNYYQDLDGIVFKFQVH